MLLLESVNIIYSKPTNDHQHLHFELCHSNHKKSSIVFRQALSVRGNCSQKSDFVANVKQLKEWFRERGDPKNLVHKETKRVLETPSSDRSKES